MGSAVWGLTSQALRDALVHAWSQEQKWAARRLELVREVDAQNLAHTDGATSTTVWLNAVLRVNPAVARKMIATATVVDDTACTATAAVFAEGVINEGQAAVIGKCVTGLADCGPDVQAGVEKILLEAADKGADPHTLAMVADHALDVVDPAAAEERLRKQLAEAEKRAARDRFFTLTPDDYGRIRLSGLLGAEAAAIVNAAMEPLCRPADPDDHRTAGQRRADAITDICSLAMATGELPENRGEKTQMVVNTGFDTLRQELTRGMLDTGATLSAEAVRRLACDAGIIPAVLGGTGMPLDVGREQRLFRGALRRALVLRDRGCAFPGCDRPPKWCEGHHPIHWCKGGKTCLANGVLLCGHHHRLIHHSEWEVYIAADGMPEFIPPAYIDPTRTPRRNTFHRRP